MTMIMKQEVKYQIRVRAKNEAWYTAARQFESVKHWEEWDDGHTRRYVREVGFTFKFPVYTIVKTENTTHKFQIYDEYGACREVFLDGLRIVTFVGEEMEALLIVSESLIEQVITQKKQEGKTYLYCYLKDDADFIVVTESLWLSEAHWKLFECELKEGRYFRAPDINLIFSSGLLPATSFITSA